MSYCEDARCFNLQPCAVHCPHEGAQPVKFPNGPLTMAGHVFVPEGHSESKKYPAIVVVHPGGGVKEQTAGLYAKELAKKGFVTLAFDASYQGESGGEPRFLDEPMNRVGDVYCAVDYLLSRADVDAEKIAVLGICAGGGFAAKAASVDPRIKVLGTVSAVNVGAATRLGWEGAGSVADLQATLAAWAKFHATDAYAPYVPELGDSKAPADMQEASQYYLADYKHPNSPNKMLLRCVGNWVAFDAFDLVEMLLKKPTISIAGSRAGSLWHSQTLQNKLTGEVAKELCVVDGATHMDFYYKPEPVATAVDTLAQFFQKHL